MTELGDLQLERPPDPDGLSSRRAVWTKLVAGLLVGIVIGGAYWFWRSRAEPAPVPAQALTTEAAAPAGPVAVAQEEPEIDLPPLDASDDLVREIVGRLSTHGALAAWLEASDLARRVAAAVDNASGGKSPAIHLRMLAPTGTFQVRRTGGRLEVHPASYARYDQLGDVVASVDADSCATAYRTLRPLFAAAYRELGLLGEFDAALARAMRLALAVPVIEEPLRLREGGPPYELFDPGLEGRSAAEKHLLRLGPRNLRIVQAKVRELGRALGFSFDS
jgi:hypothetical protein